MQQIHWQILMVLNAQAPMADAGMVSNVYMLGARGSGITKDTAAVQSAIEMWSQIAHS